MQPPQTQETCPRCWKGANLCQCAGLPTLSPRTRFLILQHPQESRNPLGTARLISLSMPGSVHRIGLSWKSLSAALKEPAEPAEWGVLFLGSLKESLKSTDQPFQILSRKGTVLREPVLKGVVLLDGNWKQAKTLWWRNPWLLKLNRIILNPAEPSRFGELRREPRKSCLSTIEAAAQIAEHLNEDPAVGRSLREIFQRHVERALSADHQFTTTKPRHCESAQRAKQSSRNENEGIASGPSGPRND